MLDQEKVIDMSPISKGPEFSVLIWGTKKGSNSLCKN